MPTTNWPSLQVHTLPIGFNEYRSHFYASVAVLCCLSAAFLLTTDYKSWSNRKWRPSSTDMAPSERTTKDTALSQAKSDDRTSTPSYNEVFPPSQRHILTEMVKTLPLSRQKAFGSLTFDQTTFITSILKLEEDYMLSDPGKYTYAGFSIAEIRALGDFPNYAQLTDVPLPTPCKNFDIDRALPRPYRPFRWAYHQTMSLTKMDPDFWLELENSYRERITERQALYAEHGSDVLQWLPGSELACKELMEMSIQFLIARYPHCFSLSADKKIFTNHIINTTHILSERHPLLVLLDNVPEDFAVMLRDPQTGCYHFRAGIICSAIGWKLSEKIGRSLPEIHQPVPDYKEKMQFSMDRFFTKMPADKPIQRGSWFFVVDQPLYMPPNDPREAALEHQDPGIGPERVHLRNDWQTLRRLPLSGAVVFNFKALFTPLTEFREEPYIPSLISKLMTGTKEEIMKYKMSYHTEHVVKPTMAKYELEQIRTGLIEENWSHRTLDEAPFFPGWKEKWHRQQGF